MAMILYSYGIVPTRSLVNEQLQYHMTDSLFNNKRVFVNLLKELNKCYNHLKENNCPFDKKRPVDDDDDEDNDVLELHTSNTVFGIHSIPPSPQELESSTYDKNELSEPPNEQNYHSQSKEGNTDDVRSGSSSQLDNMYAITILCTYRIDQYLQICNWARANYPHHWTERHQQLVFLL